MRYPSAWLQGASRGDAIASELRLQIIRGAIEQGAVISENRVAAEFGASRSPVRDALKTLSNEGLIRLERMGAVVLGLSMQDLEELYDVRYLIESFAQQRLAQGDREPLLAELRQLIDKMGLAVKHGDRVEFAQLDFRFHEAMIAEAKHARIQQLWNSIRHVVLAVMLITTDEVFSEGEAKLQSVIGKHGGLLKAIESRDAAVIRAEVRAYFADSNRTLHNSLP
ncbi:GntR family transcriptional regulator [Paenibacillus sp. MWE-103]|uniref:GntR family transcriptional regulator n=1 Tax=Paenibacillus artemisiicola TaxID=1172618 RepID=A0ABS3W7D3_9BACL|nr:GntR family transcriptional regulator [Paenibacillus artemisiicola]MBO7744219.1 GntR family transcriptional regulator [Paenibacillus artemisiicola]